MSDNVSVRETRVSHHPLDFIDDVWAALREDPASANIVLSFAEKAKHLPRSDDKDQLWIALCDNKKVEFVLSCTKGPLGNYPIFVVASKATARRVQEGGYDEDLADSLRVLVRRLLDEVPAQRVFSVFSIAKVTRVFSEIFVAEARARREDGIEAHESPYYDATLTFCTKETLNKNPKLAIVPKGSEEVTISLRLADMSDLDGLAVLCSGFSKTSLPYDLDDAGAELEARMMIEKQQVWVHLVQKNEQEPEIACLVATTRESDEVTAVTKVFTAEHWRGYKCAERLLHRVCQEIFRTKNRIVLYVGNSNELIPARKVYRRIGFQGLDEQHGGRRVEGVEKWLEIGFKGTTLGYW